MNAEKQYTDLYESRREILFSHAPEVMNRLRPQAEAHFRLAGLPSTEDENYRHTDVTQAFARNYGLNLNRLPIPVTPDDMFRCNVPHLATSLYFMVNDSFYARMSAETPFPSGVYVGGMQAFAQNYPETAARYYGRAATTADNAITALNTLLTQDGFVLYVPQGVRIERPVQLVNLFRSEADLMANRRILVILEDDAQAELLVCDHSMDSVHFLGTQVVEIFVGSHAAFNYYDLEESSVQTARFASVYVEQAKASHVQINSITLSNGLTRNNYFLRLLGERAEVRFCGLAVQDGQQHTDIHMHVTHAVPHCTSNQLFKNVLDGQATGIFNGRILVGKDAVKTQANQTCRSLSVSRDARMFGRPQLEIYADDVVCSHGMTTGQLDEQALFYMRSRGLSHEEARWMLSVAFAVEVLEHIRPEALKERLLRLVEKRFRGEQARCGECRTCG